MSNTKQEVADALAKAAVAVRDAVNALSANRAIMERFLKECRDMESFGPTLAPGLFLDKRRERISNAIAPMFQASILLIEAHTAGMSNLVDSMLDVSVSKAEGRDNG